jgi:hypothetical protein
VETTRKVLEVLSAKIGIVKPNQSVIEGTIEGRIYIHLLEARAYEELLITSKRLLRTNAPFFVLTHPI